MISYIIVLTLVSYVISLNPSCSKCKFYVPDEINSNFGSCKRFKDFSNESNKYTIENKLAIDCRNNENLCGPNGHGFQDINNKIKDVNKKYCDSEEIEQLERDFFDIMQKIKKHNKQQIYKATKDFYKLFRRNN
jgi:hypothetical protein